jgi:hypothetical protein
MDESSQFTDAVTCPICGASIPTVKMQGRFAGKTNAPTVERML